MFLLCVTVAMLSFFFFFFNDTATTEIYTLSLHDALPISVRLAPPDHTWACVPGRVESPRANRSRRRARAGATRRSEEHTSELQSRLHLVCRLLLEKKKKTGVVYTRFGKTTFVHRVCDVLI